MKFPNISAEMTLGATFLGTSIIGKIYTAKKLSEIEKQLEKIDRHFEKGTKILTEMEEDIRRLKNIYVA